jgi:hypothetical protein
MLLEVVTVLGSSSVVLLMAQAVYSFYGGMSVWYLCLVSAYDVVHQIKQCAWVRFPERLWVILTAFVFGRTAVGTQAAGGLRRCQECEL